MTEVRTRVRTCDQCGRDLTVANKGYDWHFILSGEFTPSRSSVMYDPHPEPPEDKHFCDMECLAAWTGHKFDEPSVDYAMFDVGGNMIAEAVTPGSIGNYGDFRRLAINIFKAMWAARPSSLGAQSRKPQ